MPDNYWSSEPEQIRSVKDLKLLKSICVRTNTLNVYTLNQAITITAITVTPLGGVVCRQIQTRRGKGCEEGWHNGTISDKERNRTELNDLQRFNVSPTARSIQAAIAFTATLKGVFFPLPTRGEAIELSFYTPPKFTSSSTEM